MSFFQSLIFMAFGFLSVSVASLKKNPADFPVIWNAPTFMCKSRGFDFATENAKFGILTNTEDNFIGDTIALLYNPGSFPMVLKNKTEVVEQNGGIPQLGNLKRHLEDFESSLKKVLPVDFSGYGVIDFEAWRPNWRQHWNEQTLYTNKSQELEAKKNSNSPLNKDLQAETKKNFETAARSFMEETLTTAKKLYPEAAWGYYGFPHCYNYKNGGGPECPVLAKNENDELGWLWNESTGLYPSMYISSNVSVDQYKKLIGGRLTEVQRITKTFGRSAPTYPYLWFNYNDNDKFLSKEHMKTALETIKGFKMEGVIIWGSSDNVSSKEKCEKLLDYLKKTLGPIVQQLNRSS